MAGKISLFHQEGALRSYFPESLIKRDGEREITWAHTLTPTPLSETYRVKLHYRTVHSKGSGLSLYVLDKLMLADGRTRLPHVYSTASQKLCVYYPAWREWHPGLLYVKTVIPWMSEWLYHYEIWLVTGHWHGGGIEHSESVNI